MVGFSESVMAVYSRDLMVYYIYELLEGKDAGTAFANARNVYGKNDYEYRKPSFLNTCLIKIALTRWETLPYLFYMEITQQH